MLVPLLKLLGLALGISVAVGALIVTVFLTIALAKMAWVALLQWRDLLSF